MAQPIARDAEDFARLLLQTVERLGAGGEWVAVRDAFERAAADHPDHPYLGHLAAKPGRRIALSAVTERLRAAEFAHIERRKDGTKRNAPVLYRAEQPEAEIDRAGHRTVELDLQLPQEAPSSHPLVTKRRAVEAQIEHETSARRLALTEPAAKSPWRRRLLPRRLPVASGGFAPLWSCVRAYWSRLRAAVSELAAGVSGR